MSPMETMLNKMLDDNNNEPVPVQILFRPGVKMQAGALARGPVEGLFQMGTGAHATADMPGNFTAGEMVMINMFFEADAVLQVLQFMPTSGIVSPDGVMPQ